MRILRNQESEFPKITNIELPDEFKRDDGNFQEKQNDGNAIYNMDFPYRTKIRKINPDSNTIQVGSGELIKRGTDRVLLNGISLNRGTDYQINYKTGIVTLLNEKAMNPKADLVIQYEEERNGNNHGID